MVISRGATRSVAKASPHVSTECSPRCRSRSHIGEKLMPNAAGWAVELQSDDIAGLVQASNFRRKFRVRKLHASADQRCIVSAAH